MKTYKFSKTYIGAFLYRFAFLLFVPLLQSFLFANRGALKLFTLYSSDLAVVVLLLSFAVIRCSKSEFRSSRNILDVKSGIVFRISEKSLRNKKENLLLTKGIFLNLFGGCRLKVFGGSTFSTAYLRQRDCVELLDDILPRQPEKNLVSGIFRTLLMSVSFSNALTGLLAAVPLIRRASMVLGAKQTALIIEGANLEGLLAFTGLPPILSRISSILFMFLVIGFASEFFAEYGLKFSIYSTHFAVKKGLITKTQVFFSKSSVRALVFRQSLLMFLLGFYSAEIRLNLRPRRKIHVLSAASRTLCDDLEDEVFGKKSGKVYVFYPPKDALWSFTYLPIMCFALASLGLILFSQNIIIKAILSVLSGVFAVWFLFRVFALYRTSFKIKKGIGEVKYFSGMNFTRCVFKIDDVISFQTTRSLFQRINGRCNLIVQISNSRAIKVKIKHLNVEDILLLK